MQEIKINVKQLLDIVRTNRTQHESEFNDATAGYKLEVIEQLEAALAQAKAGGPYTTHFKLTVPQSNLKDYDRVIRMLELSVDDEITLTSNEFSQYVMDEWTWKEMSRLVNSMYVGKAGM